MSLYNRINNYIHNPRVFLRVVLNHLGPLIKNDETFIKLKWLISDMQYPLNLENPKTFNEKLQWLKLYDHNPEYTIMADKVKAKEWVAERIGEEYIIPTLGVWDNPDDIDFDTLPNQFVLKCNHNSGTGMYICKDKSEMDIATVKKGLRKGLAEDYFLHGREWSYKNIPRKILAEKYMEDKNSKNGLKDYKLMCFGGKVYCSFVCSDRYSDEGLKVTFYDRDWKRMPFERHYPSAKDDIKMPEQYHNMVKLAEQLSKGIPFVRTDFYEINGNLFFGELTFYPGSGMEEFSPESWDEHLGKLIKTPMGGVIDCGTYAISVRYEASYIGLKDYKFFCFDGEPKFLYVSDSPSHSLAFLNTDWTLAGFGRDDFHPLENLPDKLKISNRCLLL